MREVNTTFPCGDIRLEGIWHFPEAKGQTPAVVVCHPHPLHGGDMSSNVVLAICEVLGERSIAALRFNFRGVGGSGGAYGQGINEQEDVRCALALARSTAGIDQTRMGLAGYSFGASVALGVAESSLVVLLALVSPALSEPGWETLKTYSKPAFVISGEHDSVVSAEAVRRDAAGNANLRVEIVPGVDHFWWGHEAMLASRVAEFFISGFKQK